MVLIKFLRFIEWLSVILATIAFAINVLVVDFAMSKFIWMGVAAYYISSITYDMLAVSKS